MRKMTLFIAGLFILTSCNTTFYQVYKVTPADNKVTKKNNGLVYEDANCIVTYNLWGENGDFSFTFYNKTNDPIYIHMGESFYINKDRAYNYYKDREFSSSRGSAVSSSQTNNISSTVFGLNYFGLPQATKAGKSKTVNVEGISTTSVTRKEELIITIPPKTYKVIDEYQINSLVYRDCDLFLYPSRNQIKTLNFNESNSPIVFSNSINYTVGESTEPIHFVNTFYVSEIGNYPESEITEKSRETICNQKLISPSLYIKDTGVDKFYIRYTKGSSRLTH